MGETELEKRQREMEILLSSIQTKVNDTDEKIDAMKSLHTNGCQFLSYKPELSKQIDTITTETKETKIALHTRIDNLKPFIWKSLSAFAGIILFLVTIIFTMNTDKLSVRRYEQSMIQITNYMEKQVEAQTRLVDEITEIKVDVSIVSTRLDNLESRPIYKESK
jgi:hypothetical protein